MGGGHSESSSNEILWLWVPDSARKRSLVRDDTGFDFQIQLSDSHVVIARSQRVRANARPDDRLRDEAIQTAATAAV